MTDKAYAVTHSDAEWRRILTPEQYQVMRSHGTEAPGSCALLLEKRPGRFSCAGCGQPLFESTRKFESGTGWPSFNDPIEDAVETSIDRTSAWSEPRFIAPIVEAILGTSLTTALHRPISATASTELR